jgi:poly(3-hydroxybutyrate) depolymerase
MLHAHALRFLCAFVPALALSGCSPEAPTSARSPIEWNRVPWAQGTLNVALVRPAEEGTGAHPVVFALSWGSGSAELVESFIFSYWLTEPAARGYYVVAPEVLGPTLDATADEIIPAIFAWMEAELSFDASKVALVGASNGGRGIFFAALSQPDRFQALVGMPGQYAGDAASLAVLAGKPIWFIVGELDTGWLAGTEATIAALESQGVTAELDVVTGQSHVLSLNDSALLDWIDAALGR